MNVRRFEKAAMCLYSAGAAAFSAFEAASEKRIDHSKVVNRLSMFGCFALALSLTF